jgi:hypothetical protein
MGDEGEELIDKRFDAYARTLPSSLRLKNHFSEAVQRVFTTRGFVPSDEDLFQMGSEFEADQVSKQIALKRCRRRRPPPGELVVDCATATQWVWRYLGHSDSLQMVHSVDISRLVNAHSIPSNPQTDAPPLPPYTFNDCYALNLPLSVVLGLYAHGLLGENAANQDETMSNERLRFQALFQSRGSLSAKEVIACSNPQWSVLHTPSADSDVIRGFCWAAVIALLVPVATQPDVFHTRLHLLCSEKEDEDFVEEDKDSDEEDKETEEEEEKMQIESSTASSSAAFSAAVPPERYVHSDSADTFELRHQLLLYVMGGGWSKSLEFPSLNRLAIQLERKLLTKEEVSIAVTCPKVLCQAACDVLNCSIHIRMWTDNLESPAPIVCTFEPARKDHGHPGCMPSPDRSPEDPPELFLRFTWQGEEQYLLSKKHASLRLDPNLFTRFSSCLPAQFIHDIRRRLNKVRCLLLGERVAQPKSVARVCHRGFGAYVLVLTKDEHLQHASAPAHSSERSDEMPADGTEDAAILSMLNSDDFRRRHSDPLRDSGMFRSRPVKRLASGLDSYSSMHSFLARYALLDD